LLSIFTANTIGSTIGKPQHSIVEVVCDGRWDERLDAVFELRHAVFELRHLQQYTLRMRKGKDRSSTTFLSFVVGWVHCFWIRECPCWVLARSEATF
jgi:hypothetical protein